MPGHGELIRDTLAVWELRDVFYRVIAVARLFSTSAGFSLLFCLVLAASIVLKYVLHRTYRLLPHCAMSLLNYVISLQCSSSVLHCTSQGALVRI